MTPSVPAYRAYARDLPHTYACGVFPCLEALAAGRALEALIAPEAPQANAGLAELLAAAAAADVPLVRGDRLLRRLSGKDNCLAVGVFPKRSDELDPAADHLVLVDPADRGNLGTIMRCAAGFGIGDLALLGDAPVDHEHPRVIRASMGARFRLRVRRFATADAYASAHPRTPVPFMSDGRNALGGFVWPRPCSLVFGPESAGLDQAWHARGPSVRIDHAPAIDSLNLAVAVGIALHANWLAKTAG